MSETTDVVKRAHSKTNYTDQQITDLITCAEDPLFFMRNFMRVQHPTKGALPFVPYEFQERIIRGVHDHRFTIILAARQLGKTTCAGAYLLWRAMFVPDTTILVTANKYLQALEIMDRIRYGYQELPNYIRAGVVEYNKGNISFDNGSRIIARATSADAGRGLAITLLYLDEMSFVAPNKQLEFWTSIQPTLSCLVGDTLVLTDKGYRKISDFHMGRRVGEYFEIEGLEVWGKDGLEAVSHGYVSPESETLVVETERGFRVEVTPSHPLYVLGSDLNGQMTKAQNLSVGDPLRIDVGMKIFGSDHDLTRTHQKTITPELAYMLGAWTAEGWISTGYCVGISNPDEDLRDVFLKSQAIKRFHPRPSDTIKLVCYCKELVELYEEMGVDPSWRCHTKRIPARIWTCDQERQAAFLRGYFDGDGCASSRSVINLSSSSRALLGDVQLMLANFGILSIINQTLTAEEQLEKKHILPQGALMKTAKDAFVLLITRSQFEKFETAIGFSVTRKAELLRRHISTSLQNDDKIMAIPKSDHLINFIKNLTMRSGKSDKWFRDNGCRLDKATKKSKTSKGVVTHRFLNTLVSLLREIKDFNFTDEELRQLSELIGPFIWDRVRTITPSNNQTYDFTVPKTHSFLQNGILGSNTGGSCIITSTPKNDEDQFAQIWHKARDNSDDYGNPLPDGLGRNGFFPIEVPWWEHPERDEEWAKPFRESLGEARFKQEFECSFISDDPTLINAMTLSRMRGKDPIFFTGTIRWYAEPQPNRGFLVALDPSLGMEADYGAIQVFQIPEMIQIAEWQNNKIDTRGQVAMLMEVLYTLDSIIRENPEQNGDPEIYWTFENNTLGEAALVVVEHTGEERFPGQLVTERRLKGLSMKRVRKGLNTSSKSRLSSLARLKTLIESGRMTIHSKNLIRELKNFISIGGQSFKAKPGEHDDLVMATSLTVRMIDIVIAWGATHSSEMTEYIRDDEFGGEIEPMPVVL